MDRDRFEQGLKVRSEVLGTDYVARSLDGADEFNRPLQQLITEYCWGEVWSRPGLSRQTRSLINIAMLSALNRPNELRIHLRGALNNGCTPAEIQEVLLQAAIYCGAPAGVEGFRIASEVLRERNPEAGAPAPGKGSLPQTASS
jgi:4-carboxymuconolactone decarboxylase